MTSPSTVESGTQSGKVDSTMIQELGAHVIDIDGHARYMGPSSGIGLARHVLQELPQNSTKCQYDLGNLFSLDDFSRGNMLSATNRMLWDVSPEELPDQNTALQLLNDFFCFTERVFPVLHRPTFIEAVNRLYRTHSLQSDDYEILGQLYLALSIAHTFSQTLAKDARIREQIRNLQLACRCRYTCLHARRDGLSRLQTLALHSYALIMLRQRSEALRLCAEANAKALECGLHHDGNHFGRNVLEMEMRRRVFWSVWMLSAFTSSLAGLPRNLHEADITVAEPSDIDDDQISENGVAEGLPGPTKIHRFISVCRLVRILSRVLDALYTTTQRKQASTRIAQM